MSRVQDIEHWSKYYVKAAFGSDIQGSSRATGAACYKCKSTNVFILDEARTRKRSITSHGIGSFLEVGKKNVMTRLCARLLGTWCRDPLEFK